MSHSLIVLPHPGGQEEMYDKGINSLTYAFLKQ